MVNRKYFQIISFLKQTYVSLKSYTYLMISSKFIHCLLPKRSKRSLSFTWKHNNMEMVNTLAIDKNKTLICETLNNTGVMGRLQKCKFFILLGFNNTKVLLKYFLPEFIFCSGRAFQRNIDNDNPTVVSVKASKNIFTAFNFWTDYRMNIPTVLTIAPQYTHDSSRCTMHS